MIGNDLDRLVDSYSKTYKPLITADEAAEIAHRRIQTIYDWSSRGILDAFKSKRSGILLLDLRGFIRFLFDQNEK